MIVYGMKLAACRGQVVWRQRLKDRLHNDAVSIYVYEQLCFSITLVVLCSF